MKHRRLTLLTFVLMSSATAEPCFAWGNLGHSIIGEVAYNLLSPKAKTAVDQLLAMSNDPMTLPDFAHRATWADKQRQATHGATAAWHYVNTDLDTSAQTDAEIAAGIERACHRHVLHVPAASEAAPTDECVVAKLDEFERDLADPKTPASEKLFALLFLEHFVGDVSQPLHAISDDDAGGNCVWVSYGRRVTKLHAYWDDVAVEDSVKGFNPITNGDLITRSITKADIKQWYGGTPTTWAIDSYKIAVADAYTGLRSRALPTCAAENAQNPIALSEGYRTRAAQVARSQLMKAGIRLAYVLNTTLGK